MNAPTQTTNPTKLTRHPRELMSQRHFVHRDNVNADLRRYAMEHYALNLSHTIV